MILPKPTPKTLNLGAVLARWDIMRWLPLFLGITLAILAIFLLSRFFQPLESWRLYLLPAEKAIPIIHQLLYRRARAWGLAADAARTPNEFAGAFSVSLDRFAGNHRLAPTISALRRDVNWLTDLYVRFLFSPHLPTQPERRQAVRNWSRIRRSFFKLPRP